MSEIAMRRPALPASESESESECESESEPAPASESESESASGSESGSEPQRKRKRSPWATWTYRPPQLGEFAEVTEVTEVTKAEEAKAAEVAVRSPDAEPKVDVSAEAARITARLNELRDANHVPAFKLEAPTREWLVPPGFAFADRDAHRDALAAVYFDFAAGNVARSHAGVFLDLHATQLAVPDHELRRFLIGAATAAHASTLLSVLPKLEAEEERGAALGVVLLVSPHGLHVTYGLGHFLDDEPVTVHFPPPAPAAPALTANELAEKIARSAPEPNEQA